MESIIETILSEAELISRNAKTNPLLVNFIRMTHKSIYLLRMGQHDLARSICVLRMGQSNLARQGNETVYKVLFPDVSSKNCDLNYDQFAFRDYTSELLECRDKFAMLHEIVEDTLKAKIQKLSLIKSVFEKAISFFGEKYQEQISVKERENREALLQGLAHSIGDLGEYEAASCIAIGEATCYCIFKGWITDGFYPAYGKVMEKVSTIQRSFKLEDFKKSISRTQDEEEAAKAVFTIDATDYLTGSEFERFVGRVLLADGFTVFYTNAGADQGVDIVAQKEGIKIAVQAKRYAGKVGNSSVQEVVAGKAHYYCDKAMVVTNSYFTKSAISLSTSNDVLLCDRDLLESKIQRLSLQKDIAPLP